MNEIEARSSIDLYKLEHAKKKVINNKPFDKLPRSLWKAILSSLNLRMV